MTLVLALVAAAISLGAIHTLAPDHWVPFAALARAERWSAGRTATITAACGLGHVTVSVGLGALALLTGLELFQRFGHRLESASGLLLVGFGAAYGAWGMHRALAGRVHAHAHALGRPHGHLLPLAGPHSRSPVTLRSSPSRSSLDSRARDAGADAVHRPLTAWSLFVLFSFDPCVAVIPLLFASAPLGWPAMLGVVAAYETATIGTMILLVLPARAAAAAVKGAWADRWGDALAGAVVALVGLVVVGLGI